MAVKNMRWLKLLNAAYTIFVTDPFTEKIPITRTVVVNSCHRKGIT